MTRIYELTKEEIHAALDVMGEHFSLLRMLVETALASDAPEAGPALGVMLGEMERNLDARRALLDKVNA